MSDMYLVEKETNSEWEGDIILRGTRVVSHILVVMADKTAAITQVSVTCEESVSKRMVANAAIEIAKKTYSGLGHEVVFADVTSKQKYDEYTEKFQPKTSTLRFQEGEQGKVDCLVDGKFVKVARS